MKERTMDNKRSKKFYSVEEFSKLLGVSKSLIYNMVYKGEIPVRRAGKRILIPEIYVEQWFK